MEQNENKNVETAEATQVSHEETRKKLKKQRVRQIIASLIGVAILAFGLWKIVCLFLDYNSNETSNDAQIEQYISPVNLRASGYIAKVCFREHQEVHKGDTLLVLDDREYRIRLMEAEAALKDAKAGANVINAKVCFREHQEVHKGDTLLVLDDREYRIRLMEAEAALKDAKAGANVINATEQTTETSASIYQASIDEINVRLAKLAKDCERYRNLVEKKAATPIQLEQLEVEYAATRKKLEGVKKQQAAAYKGVNEVTTRKQNVAASIERAEAAVEMAKLNLSYCVVVAPCDGKLGRRSIEEGQMVNAGTTITYIIPTNNKWVIANYKETQIENLYVGQKVRMTVDAISNKEFEGTVTAISGATGSKYSLVPTDNSAGNFVKIQQRVPVRIDFNNLSKEDNEHLAAGMMVVVKAERK